MDCDVTMTDQWTTMWSSLLYWTMNVPCKRVHLLDHRKVFSNPNNLPPCNAQCTRTDFFVIDKKQSENRFVCADFCSDIKSLQSFLGVAYDKKSVCVRWLQSEKKSELRHPTMGPRLLLSHTIAPIKNRSVCADFRPEKKSDLHSDFFSELLTSKNRSLCAGHKWGIWEIGLLASLRLR